MALWAGSGINTNETAKVFNKLSSKRSIPIIVKLNALLYAWYGMDDQTNLRAGTIETSSSITGKNVEVDLMGKLAAPAAISDGSDELSSQTVNYDSAVFGGAEFAVSHYGMTQGIPNSELDRFKGDESKTLDYIGDIHDYIMSSYEDVFGTDLASTNVPARSHFGGWQAAVDDANTYGTIDRTDSANADFCGKVNASYGDTTLPKLQANYNTIRTKNGQANLAVTGETLFAKIQQQVQAYSHVVYNAGSPAEFGSATFIHAGVKWLLDQRTTAGVIGIFDTKWWRLIKKDNPFTSSGIMLNPSLKAAHVIVTELWATNICVKPNAQVKNTSCT